MTSTQGALRRMTRPILWTTRWSALLGLSVLLLAPTAAHSRDDPVARLDARFADFQPIDAYVTSQMQAMHIPGVGLGIMQLVEARSNCIFNGLVGIARQRSADNLACGDTARVVEQMADS